MSILTRFISKHFRVGRTRKDKSSASSSITTFPLFDLPPELIGQILSNIPIPTLLFYRTTCRAFNALISSSPLLQYVIALQFHGLSDNTHCSLSVADRLYLLTAREQAWRTFSPKFTQRIHLRSHHHASWVHHLADSVVLLGDSVTHQKVIAASGNAIWATKVLRYLVLRSDKAHGYGSIARPWRKIDPDRDILNVAMAIHTNDLIAIVTSRPDAHSSTHCVIETYLIQFSTRKVHPDANLHPLTITHSIVEARRPEVSVDVLGSHLAVLVVYGPPPVTGIPDEFFLFNWKTGILTMSLQFPHRTYHSFIFLTTQTLLLPNITTGALDIFHISDQTTESHLPLRVACSLSLPALKRSFCYDAICSRAEPKPQATCAPSALHSQVNRACRLDHRPFRPSPAHTILLFTIAVRNVAGNVAWGTLGRRAYTLAVHRESILAHIPALPFSNPARPSPRTAPKPRAVKVPWKLWGPRCTRWLDSQGVAMRLYNTSVGQRHVRLMPDRRIHMLDFNPWHVRWVQAGAGAAGSGGGVGDLSSPVEKWLEGTRNDSSSSGSGSTGGLVGWSAGEVSVVSGRSVLRSGGDSSPWKSKVYSELAYVLTVSDGYFQYSAVMMDEERVIGVKSNIVEDKITALRLLHFG